MSLLMKNDLLQKYLVNFVLLLVMAKAICHTIEILVVKKYSVHRNTRMTNKKFLFMMKILLYLEERIKNEKFSVFIWYDDINYKLMPECT